MVKSKDTSIKANSSSPDEYFAGNTIDVMPQTFKILDNVLSYRILSHALYWIAVALITAYQGSLFGGTFKDNLISMTTLLPIQMLVAYLLVYWQIPSLLFKRKKVIFFLSLLATAYIASVLARYATIYIAEPLMGFDGIDESLFEILADPIYLIVVYLVSLYLPAVIFFLIKMTKKKFEHENHVAVLSQEKRVAELNFLKAQMNPHFLFNTLNNIYSLAKKKSENTSEMILKLSEILDYTIYECKNDRVLISKEWELIENYVDLEVLRFSSEVDLSLHKDIDDEHSTIAPLILIAIVENAFKFGLGKSNDVPFIRIDLTVKDNILEFNVKNSISPISNKQVNDDKEGIGVENIKRQLVLSYPKRHTLKVDHTEATHHVTLTIQLK